VIAPRDGAQLLADGDSLDVALTARISGIADDDSVQAGIDDLDKTVIAHTGGTANGSINIPVVEGDHQLVVAVLNPAGELLAKRTTRFTVADAANIALVLERQEPANNARGIEPNAFIACYFNKPIDPQLLQIKVFETAHGLNYVPPEPGAGLTRLSDIKLEEVHRDHEEVTGGVAHFAGNHMVAFYPNHDFAYGAKVFVNIDYNDQELSRTSYHIRKLPTFIQGFVADQFMQPVEGIAVEITELNRQTLTDANGSYGFGFGDPADQDIPSGRYRAVINKGLQNRSFGTVERWISVEEGRLNSVGLTPLPILNPDEPFRRIGSGDEQAILAAEQLRLNLSEASLNFPDGRTSGDVHVQVMKIEQVAYPVLPSVMPHWVFAVQPMGVEVAGNVGLTIDMPALFGNHEYLQVIGERVVLIGFDPDVMQIVPVGVGKVDADNKRVVSQGQVALERLDFLGYALIDHSKQPILERLERGEIGLRQMVGELAAE
jgi:hypothetical protein